MSTDVFVYGTLKAGYGNNRLLKDSEFLGVAVTKDKFGMIGYGYPMAAARGLGDQRRIVGEVYRVTDKVLADLDRLEWKGRLYDRVGTDVMIGDELHTVQMYVGTDRAVQSRLEDGVPTPWINSDGHWEWRYK